jgi:hypothetical protein
MVESIVSFRAERAVSPVDGAELWVVRSQRDENRNS